ncbi:MAG: hypothetical protein ACKOB6_05800 [Candidatus Kapaibacterium sp.]
MNRLSQHIRCLFVVVIATVLSWDVSMEAQPCRDVMVLQGSEPLESYGMDTTVNWWAKTVPYSGMKRLWVNGRPTEAYQDVTMPVFSPDGDLWGAWGLLNTQWFLLSEGVARKVVCTEPGDIVYGALSQTQVISFFDGPQEYVRLGDRQYVAVQRRGAFCVSPLGTSVAWLQGPQTATQIIINGKLLSTYEDVLLFGFWVDGKLMYAAKSGTQWRWYLGDEEVAGPYSDIREARMNRAGNCAGAVVVQGGFSSVVLISDEYTRPVVSKQYPSIDALVLHPTEPMWAARVQQPGNDIVLMTGVEYVAATQGTGRPWFTWDGKEMVFFGCDTDCFLSINGRRVPIQLNVPLDVTFVREPGSSTYAMSTLTSLVVRELERKDIAVGTMCEETSKPRYNRKTRRYEALGRINQRLYLLNCVK